MAKEMPESTSNMNKVQISQLAFFSIIFHPEHFVDVATTVTIVFDYFLYHKVNNCLLNNKRPYNRTLNITYQV